MYSLIQIINCGKNNIITEALKDGQSLGGSASFYEDVNVDGETATVITKDGNYTIDYAEAGTQLMHNGNVLTPVSIEPMESQKDGKHIHLMNPV